MAGGHQRISPGKFPRVHTEDSRKTNNFQGERINPIYGISSEGYQGKGFVQSKSAKAQGITIEPEE